MIYRTKATSATNFRQLHRSTILPVTANGITSCGPTTRNPMQPTTSSTITMFARRMTFEITQLLSTKFLRKKSLVHLPWSVPTEEQPANRPERPSTIMYTTMMTSKKHSLNPCHQTTPRSLTRLAYRRIWTWVLAPAPGIRITAPAT